MHFDSQRYQNKFKLNSIFTSKETSALTAMHRLNVVQIPCTKHIPKVLILHHYLFCMIFIHYLLTIAVSLGKTWIFILENLKVAKLFSFLFLLVLLVYEIPCKLQKNLKFPVLLLNCGWLRKDWGFIVSQPFGILCCIFTQIIFSTWNFGYLVCLRIPLLLSSFFPY